MLFNSVTYLFVFLPLVCVLYWRLPARPRLWLVLLASLVFYGFWRFDFVPLVLLSAMLDYYIALAIGRSQDETLRRRLMLVSMLANLAILGFFKYLIFFTGSAYSLARMIGYEPGPVELKIILPLGISFYIFQTMSYTLDVYRREFPPKRDMLTYLCFVTFFGHMVAGPILRARVLIPQFEIRPAFEPAFVTEGIKRILAGLFLKVVLADTMAGYVDTGFARPPGELGPIDAWTLAFLFGFQIYFDFAGYSHIAIGSARLMGIHLPENFNFPYLSSSPREFWQRWHISLSAWIRDYLYLPLLGTFHSSRDQTLDPISGAGRRVSPWRRTYALFTTWIIMGLWHGANWTFALWGLYHATLVQGQRLLMASIRPGEGLHWRLAGFAVTLPLAMAGWVPFRCTSVGDALVMWTRMLDVSGFLRPSLSLPPNAYLTCVLLLAGMLIVWGWTRLAVPYLSRSVTAQATLGTAYFAVTAAFVIVFLQVKAQFIYFQF